MQLMQKVVRLGAGFDALEYKEHADYEIVQSTHKEHNNAVIRVNIFRNNRQTIQYVQPQDHMMLGQAGGPVCMLFTTLCLTPVQNTITELLVIDEAAAIPLPLVKKLMGNYLVFMSSTVNGYEGTGRSLSHKLVKDLRRRSANTAARNTSASGRGRTLREITLSQPIRYAQNDMVEEWLNKLLCLDCG